eukprot:m.213281 g.213281  ORF g.213281 m.213281 type:complete len:142 (+) comp15859_c0_seq22:215-640(+)
MMSDSYLPLGNVNPMQGSKAEEEIGYTVRAFESWTHQQRREFFHEMLCKSGATSELADLFSGSMSVSEKSAPGITMSFPPQNTRDQVDMIWSWFDRWGDKEKNALLNALETIDQAAVYEFYQHYSDAQAERPWSYMAEQNQ